MEEEKYTRRSHQMSKGELEQHLAIMDDLALGMITLAGVKKIDEKTVMNAHSDNPDRLLDIALVLLATWRHVRKGTK